MRIYSARSGFASPIVIICCFMSEVKHNALSSKNELDALSGVVSQSPIVRARNLSNEPKFSLSYCQNPRILPSTRCNQPSKDHRHFWPHMALYTHTHLKPMNPSPTPQKPYAPGPSFGKAAKGCSLLPISACSRARSSGQASAEFEGQA